MSSILLISHGDRELWMETRTQRYFGAEAGADDRRAEPRSFRSYFEGVDWVYERDVGPAGDTGDRRKA